ncbi:DUF551 domain-containing protein [Cohnella sp. 56]|uniref:DUF551 domain-containing protein n=1 Tax=Cohnella sp. 56 TaxID=3113722 RepID=UPI0030E7CB2E
MTDTVNKQHAFEMLKRESKDGNWREDVQVGLSVAAEMISLMPPTPSTPVQGYREALIDRCADLNHYDDDQFTPPMCIDELPEADADDVMDWPYDILRACADNVYGVMEDDGMLSGAQPADQLREALDVGNDVLTAQLVDEVQRHAKAVASNHRLRAALESISDEMCDDDSPRAQRINKIIDPALSQTDIQPSGWIPVSRRMPEVQTPVLATYSTKTYMDKTRSVVVMAQYFPAKTVKACDFLQDGVDGDYDEDQDEYFVPEGWWESSDEAETVYALTHDVTHWMPLPKPPGINSTEDQPRPRRTTTMRELMYECDIGTEDDQP